MIFEKKNFLKVRLIHIYEIFETDLQKDCHMYSCGKCIIATTKDQSLILHILQVKLELAKGII